jgi:hypothetical protein
VTGTGHPDDPHVALAAANVDECGGYHLVVRRTVHMTVWAYQVTDLQGHSVAHGSAATVDSAMSQAEREAAAHATVEETTACREGRHPQCRIPIGAQVRVRRPSSSLVDPIGTVTEDRNRGLPAWQSPYVYPLVVTDRHGREMYYRISDLELLPGEDQTVDDECEGAPPSLEDGPALEVAPSRHRRPRAGFATCYPEVVTLAAQLRQLTPEQRDAVFVNTRAADGQATHHALAVAARLAVDAGRVQAYRWAVRQAGAAASAAVAMVVRDLLAPELYQQLVEPWTAVVGDLPGD